MKYLIVLFASFALMGCATQKTGKSKEIVEVNGDPSYAIMKTIDNTNRNIGNTISNTPNPPVK